MVENGEVAGDHRVYHIGLVFNPLSPEAIALCWRQSRAAWRAVMDEWGCVVQISSPVVEAPPPDYNFRPQGCGGVNQLVLIEEEMNGEPLNKVEVIYTGGRGGFTWQAH